MEWFSIAALPVGRGSPKECNISALLRFGGKMAEKGLGF